MYVLDIDPNKFDRIKKTIKQQYIEFENLKANLFNKPEYNTGLVNISIYEQLENTTGRNLTIWGN